MAHKYGITSAMIKDVKVHISYGDTEEKVAKRVMNHYQEKIIDDTSDIFDLKEEISQLTPDSQEFRDKLNELSWKHTSSIKNVDMANLAHLVVRRSTIVDILKMTIDGQLDCQVDNVGRNKNEALIHNIFFPMRKDTPEVKDHDIWLLNEEYSYYDYISSDKPLASVKWDGDETLFDADIDDEMAKITTQVYDENKNTRPDIAIFSKEGAAIIIEFKAPDVSLEKHTSEVVKYAKVLASKSKGKINRFYGYLIGSKIDHTALDDYSRFANDKGWFKTSSLVDYDTREHLGELYSEILFYDDVVEKASMRLKAYKDKLNPS